MKIIKDNTNTYPRRLWFEDGEIEEKTEIYRLGYANLVEKLETPALPVDKFIEIYLPQILGTEVSLDPYADLQRREGERVLGASYFFDDHLEVKIDRSVTEEADNWEWR